MHHTSQAAPRLPYTLCATAALAVGLLTLTGCAGGTGASDAPSAEPTPTDPETGTMALPATPLRIESGYDGPPRTIADLHHMACLEAISGGEEIPEKEQHSTQEGITAWSVMEQYTISEGWKYCKPGVFDVFAVPSSFVVTAEPAEPGYPTIRIQDAEGQRLGGLQQVPAGHGAGSTELVEVLEIEKLPESPAYQGQDLYQRTLVVEGGSGLQLMIDLVTAGEGEDPESLEVWDVDYGPEGKATQLWAVMPLDSAEQASGAMQTQLYEVLYEMVGSFTASVQ